MQVQASEKELRRHLRKLQACEIDGHWRLLCFDYKGKVLEHVLNLREEKGWSYDEMCLQTCWQELGQLYDRYSSKRIVRDPNYTDEIAL